MSEQDRLLAEIPDKLQQLTQFGKTQQLSHAIRNQLNGLSLAFQTLLLQSELQLPPDQTLLNLSCQQWNDFLTLRDSSAAS